MEADRWDGLFEESEDDGLDAVRELMGSRLDLGLTGMTWNAEGGFIEAHEVRVTEPWRPSLVRLGERPRVGASASNKQCAQCGTTFRGINRAKYCGLPDCTRARTARRMALMRSK